MLNCQGDNVMTSTGKNDFENYEKGNYAERSTVNWLLLREIVNVGVEVAVILTEVDVCL